MRSVLREWVNDHVRVFTRDRAAPYFGMLKYVDDDCLSICEICYHIDSSSGVRKHQYVGQSDYTASSVFRMKDVVSVERFTSTEFGRKAPAAKYGDPDE